MPAERRPPQLFTRGWTNIYYTQRLKEDGRRPNTNRGTSAAGEPGTVHIALSLCDRPGPSAGLSCGPAGRSGGRGGRSRKGRIWAQPGSEPCRVERAAGAARISAAASEASLYSETRHGQATTVGHPVL